MNDTDCTCIVCEKSLGNIMDERGFQPDCGLAFHTYGHYGSTFFDPMDGSYLEIAVCDDCIRKASEREQVRSGKTT